jgi:hypothetical protein
MACASSLVRGSAAAAGTIIAIKAANAAQIDVFIVYPFPIRYRKRVIST